LGFNGIVGYNELKRSIAMSKLLESAAVGVKGGEEAKEILQSYIATEPAMVLNHTLAMAQASKPKGTGAGDNLIEPR
jgi:hypothetical protein